MMGMTTKRVWIGLVIVLVLIVGGYYGYTYLKDKPPHFLIELLTKTKPPPPLPEGVVAPLIVPEGFKATIYSRETPGARVLTRDPKGTMLVSETSQGKVVALTDTNNDGVAEAPITVLEGLKQPHGIVTSCNAQGVCTLYVAETGELKSYDYDAATLKATYRETLATFPTGDGHFTRTLLMEPNNKLLVSIGSSCNVCGETNPLRASVQELDLATKQLTAFATGLRNSVFLALHPVTGEVWATENGRDVIGDDIPPDEINIVRKGGNYGWPICFGKQIHDGDFDKRQYFRDPCADTVPSYLDLQAHSAALGLAFAPEEGWPADMANDLFVAYHGSWNRSVPTGYKVVRFDLNADGSVRSTTPTDFVTGFLPEGADEDGAIGRPVGLLAEPGGVLYVSDDRAGAVYKISRTSE